MPLTRLDNLYSSKTGKYLYVSPDDFNATDELDNRGNSPLRPFKTIQRAFIEVSRYSYLPGKDNDRFDQFSVMLMPGNHYIDNRPGLVDAANPEVRFFDAANLIDANRQAIVDRAAADIATNHPDFYYPNDSQTQDYSRFKDAFRLLQLNRQEIIDTSWTKTLTQYANHGSYEETCKRDLGLFIDSLALDVAQADGNQYTRKFLKTFFNEAGTSWLNDSLNGEQAEANYAFEQARDQMFLAISNQLSVQDLTITADNAPGSDYGTATQSWKPTGATYSPSNGELVLEIADHGLSIGDHINIASGSLVFSCDSDSNATDHAYPRANDPAAGKYLEITQVATDFITVDVGHSPIVNYTPTDATYDPATGDFVLTIGVHNLSLNETVKIADSSITMTCDMDGNITDHVYPRTDDPAYNAALSISNVGSTHTPIAGTEYNSLTGILTLSIDNHTFVDGDQVKLADGAVTFSCDKDDNATDHSYPRITDPASNNWLTVSNAQPNGTGGTVFNVNVGLSPDVPYNVSAATYIPTTGLLTLDIGNHNFSGETSRTATTATYTPSTGVMQLTIPDHNYISGDRIKILDNSLVFTCDQDRNNTEHAYPRSTDPYSGKWLPVTNLTNDTVDVHVGATTGVNYTPTDADYNPANGNLVLTIGNHTLNAGRTLKLATGSLIFTCAMDDHFTEHTYPRATDPVYDKPITIASVGSTSHEVTGADYSPTTGVLTLTVPTLTISNGERIQLDDNSLTFTCAKDNNSTPHTYPRSTDDASTKWLEVSNVNAAANTFDVNVSISPDTTAHLFVSATATGLKHQDGTITLNVGVTGNVDYDVSGATFTPTTGEMVLTLSDSHTIRQGSNIRLKEESLIFTCAQDSHGSDHAYPRTTIENHTAADAGTSYDGNTGVLTIQTTAAHGMRTGDWVKIADNSLTFTCAMDGSTASPKTYPRATDPISGKWLKIDNATVNTFTIQVGSTPLVNHNVTDATYDQVTGVMVLTIGANHGLQANTSIKLADNALTFTCDKDNNATDHTYPRNDGTHDTVASNTAINIDAVDQVAGTITINVGAAAANDQYDHTFKEAIAGAVIAGGAYQHTCTTAVTDGISQKKDRSFDSSVEVTNVGSTNLQPLVGTGYTPANGILRIKCDNHGVVNGDRVKLKTDGITFTCDKDNHQTDHTYPRITDPVAGDWLLVSNASTDYFDLFVGISNLNLSSHIFASADADAIAHQDKTITINVGISSDESAHTFSTTAGNGDNAVILGGSYDHTFKSANADAIVTGGDYVHTWVSSVNNGIVKSGDSIKIGANTLKFTCAYNGHSTQHTYPRPKDPAYETLLPIISSTATEVVVDIGISPDTSAHTFIGAEVGAVTSGGNYPHSFKSALADSVTKQDGTITVNIGQTSTGAVNVTGATYDAASGHMVLDVGANHGILQGQSIKLAEESISFSCTYGAGVHTYVGGTVSNAITGNQNGVQYDVTDATYDSATGILVLTTPASQTLTNANSILISNDALTFTCDADNHQTNHTYPRAGVDPFADNVTIQIDTVDIGAGTIQVNVGPITAASQTKAYPRATIENHTAGAGTTYDSSTGILNIQTTADHGMRTGDWVKIDDAGLTFSCGFGGASGAAAEKTYPRATDPISGKWIQVTVTGTNTFTLNALRGTTPSNVDIHAFVSAVAGSIKQKVDRAYDTALPIIAAHQTNGTITIDVGQSGNNGIHTFQSAVAGAVITGGNHPHTFVSAAAGALISGGNYGHLFKSAADNAVTFAANINNRANNALCADIQSFLGTLTTLVTDTITAANLNNLPAESVSAKIPAGEEKCKRDIGYFIDSVVSDLRNGGNSNIISTTKTYFDRDGNPINPGLLGEVAESVTAFNGARDQMTKAVSNQLYSKDLVVTQGPAIAGQTTPDIDYGTSGSALACSDVQSNIITLTNIMTSTLTAGNLSNLVSVQVTGTVPIFDYNQALEEWQDDSILDLSNPDNVLYKFNASDGGAIVPRGCSLIGYDLRRTIVRPLYVPDCVDGDVGRSGIFRLTGGCYLWQMTIKDGDLSSNSPLYSQADNVAKVYNKPNDFTSLVVPEYSHHKITIMSYADNEDLDVYYQKVGRAFAQFQPTIDDGELEQCVQENRIVGPLSDTRNIESIKVTAIDGGAASQLEVTTKVDHGYYVGQYVATLNSGLSSEVNGTWKITGISSTNPKVFTYNIRTNPYGLGLVDNATYTTANGLGTGAVIQAEIDSVESASPYVFNCSIRSTWGYCGMWADGSRTTGFRSMVVAQYTGVTLQKDDRAFIRYDRFNNTWNQASLTDAFATTPYHTKGDAYWKDAWRNWHIKASDDAFIQCVSVFAVGYHDHFIMESGGDMSITNSNSNFGNTSLHAKGFKGYAFNQDKGGYIDAIVPPKLVDSSAGAIVKNQYYTIDIETSNDQSNHSRLYIAGDEQKDPAKRPAANIGGYRLGAKYDDQIFVNLSSGGVGGKKTYHATLSPSGWTSYTASLSTITPSSFNFNFDLDSDGNSDFNTAQDAATLIEKNRQFIAEETYGYITNKYPNLLTNQSLSITKCQRDVGYFVDAVIKDLRVGGNVNSINTANSYFVGSNLNYVTNELTETLDAYGHAKKIMMSTMRNFTLLIKNCTTTNQSATVVVGDTSGLHSGMKVQEFNSNDFTNGWVDTGTATPIVNTIADNIVIDSIVNATTITLRDTTAGTPYLAGGDSTTAWLYFTTTGNFATAQPVADDSITISADYPECTSIATAIQGYFDTVNLIMSGNANSVTRVEPIIESSSLSGRATVFTVNTGQGQSDPHGFQTGTPVRLIPTAINSVTDKRLVRLPRGFQPNTTYYVIAPGRDTYPYTFNGSSDFDTTASTKLMLASSKENAAAGIYIFSPETDFMDSGVEVLIQQYVVHDSYDLYRYVSNVGAGGAIKSEVPHLFDIPLANVVGQKIFFGISTETGSALPIVSSGDHDGWTGTVRTNKYYYPRFQTKNSFTIHLTQADAQAGVNEVLFTGGSNFLVYGDKKTSPLKYDAETFERWYLNVKEESVGGSDPDNILTRFHDADFLDGTGNLFTPDTWFERLEDKRVPDDRIYRLRYVIPQYLQNVREPLNGYVVKTRTDDRRRLRPQKFQLEPIGGAPDVAEFYNPSQPTEQLGLNLTTLDAAGVDVENRDNLYDPYKNPLSIEFDSLFKTTIQSAKVVSAGADRLELTVFDHHVENTAVKNEQFVILEIAIPQGAGIQSDLYNSNSTNYVAWAGSSTGSGYVHAYYEYGLTSGEPGFPQLTAFVVLKGIEGKLEHGAALTTFTQSNGTFWTSMGRPDSFGLPDSTKSRSNKDSYLYRMDGANLYTLCPGDKVTTPTGHTYSLQLLEDVPEVEDTFYIFDVETIQEVIPAQQDGIYYLTAVRGNISPYPTGAGVGDNFRNYKFSQPISSLYPFNYKNDPLWFQVQANGTKDTNITDPSVSISAANNYVHGYVTLNDNKFSETKEAVVDLLATDPLKDYEFTNTTAYYQTPNPVLDNRIQAQGGNASIGSENRQIPISGDSQFPLEDRFYIELRRPSIARSGNHTFEYLGYGPGNYSTGFPLRQEVVLSDYQDYYAQAKREDAGVVFYTGLNSNGDLYIGNRKINAITGEETFLEKAELQETEDDQDSIGALVTTFDTAVTFNDKITVEGDAYLNNPVHINVDPQDGDSLRIYSHVGVNDDPTLDRTSFRDNKAGDILLTRNITRSAVFQLTGRGNVGDIGQGYSLRTHYTGGKPSNVTPNNSGLYSAGAGGTAFYTLQNITYGSSIVPVAGDVLYKGLEIGNTGSLGWIYTNYYTEIPDLSILTLTADNSALITAEWASGISNNGLGIRPGEYVRISNFSNTFFNGTWAVIGTGFDGTASTCRFYLYNQIAANTYSWANEGAGAKIEISKSSWKETGLLGTEALRTLTEVPGDYRLGINTIGRMAIEGALTASTSVDTDPRANLDVVGTAFISGKSLVTYDSLGAVTDNKYLQETSNNKTYNLEDNALLVGGDSTDADDYATLRVATSDALEATFQIVTGGTGYTPGTSTLTTTGGSGDAALTVSATCNASGIIESAVVVASGSGYKADDILTLVGGNSDATIKILTYRHSTYQPGGRVAINAAHSTITDKALDRNLVVVGDSRFTGNVKIHDDLSVDGGDINSTAETFQFINLHTDFFIGLANAESIILGNTTTNSQTINIGNSVGDTSTHVMRIGSNAGNSVLEIHRATENAYVEIATSKDTVGSQCDVRIGGAAPNLDSKTYIGTYQTKLAGTLEIGAFAGTSSTRIFSTAGHVDLIDGQHTNTLTLGKNTSGLEIAGVGGITTIRNSLEVLASATVNSHIKLVGGLQAGIIEVERAMFSAGTCTHIIGSLANPNIDFLKYVPTGKEIDTSGQGNWGGTTYLLAGGQIAGIDNILPMQDGAWVTGTYSFIEPTGGTGSGALFTIDIDINGNSSLTLATPGSGYSDNDQLTIPAAALGNAGSDITFKVNGVNAAGNLYDLPITQPAVNDFKIGDLILIERGHASSPDTIDNVNTGLRDEAFNEIVEVVGLTNVTNPNDPLGYRLAVSRAVDGTTARTDHPDETIIAKFDKQPNASYITGFDFDLDGEVDEVATILIVDADIQKIVGDDTDIVTIHWQSKTNNDLSIDLGEFIQITGSNIAGLNGTWPIQSGFNGVGSTVTIKTASNIVAGETLWSTQTTGAMYVTSAGGLPPGTTNVRIGVAEFGGILTTNDYLRLSNCEIVKVVELTSTDIQSFIINDGGVPENITFKVESTTGNTFGQGDLNFGQGFNKLVMDKTTGNTSIAGTLTTENTLTVNGSTIEKTEWFRLTNGGDLNNASRTTLEVDTATGDLSIYGGDMHFFSEDGNTTRLSFENSSGDFATYGALSAFGSGVSKFGGGIQIGGAYGTTDTDFPHRDNIGLTINSGQYSDPAAAMLTINSDTVKIFEVANDGALTVAGISNYITQSGGRKWEYSASSVIDAVANTNYFVNASQNTVVKLPMNPPPLIGDMIRIIDIGGLLTYNLTLVIRAPNNTKVQNSSTNTGTAMLTGNSANLTTTHNGGELVVQTPYAGFALVYAGTTTPDGGTAAPDGKSGWYLIEV